MPYVEWRFLELAKPGLIKLSGTRMAILGSEYISAMTQELEKVIGYSAAKGLLYRIFKEAAAERIKKLEFYKGSEPQTVLLSKTIPLMIEIGWVTEAEVKQSSEAKAVVEVRDSVFRGGEQGATNPKCHPLAGVLAAIWSLTSGRDYDCTEVACAAMNEEKCTFHVTPSVTSG